MSASFQLVLHHVFNLLLRFLREILHLADIDGLGFRLWLEKVAVDHALLEHVIAVLAEAV